VDVIGRVPHADTKSKSAKGSALTTKPDHNLIHQRCRSWAVRTKWVPTSSAGRSGRRRPAGVSLQARDPWERDSSAPMGHLPAHAGNRMGMTQGWGSFCAVLTWSR